MMFFDSLLPDWLFPSRSDRVVSSTDLKEADLLYATSRKTEMRENVIQELDSRGLEVAELGPGDIEEDDGDIYLDGTPAEDLDTTVFYREKRFLEGAEDREDAKEYMKTLGADYGIDFVNSPAGAEIADSKEKTKDVLEEAYSGIDDVEVPETYETLEDLEDLEAENLVTRKEGEGSLGRGIDFLEAGEIDDLDGDAVYEEFIDHYSGNAKDMRAFVVGGEPVTVKERVKDTDEPEPKNIASGGHYEDPDSVSLKGVEAASIASESLDMPVAAVDYAELEDGSVKVYEVNSTAQTSIDSKMDDDLYGLITDYLEEEAGEEDAPDGDIIAETAGEKASAV